MVKDVMPWIWNIYCGENTWGYLEKEKTLWKGKIQSIFSFHIKRNSRRSA